MTADHNPRWSKVIATASHIAQWFCPDHPHQHLIFQTRGALHGWCQLCQAKRGMRLTKEAV